MNTLDLAAAAAFLGLHPHTLQARAKAGEIPGAKVGNAGPCLAAVVWTRFCVAACDAAPYFTESMAW